MCTSASETFVKRLLYSSYLIAPEHLQVLMKMVGEDPTRISIAAISNATDVEDDAAEWVSESEGSLTRDGAQVESIDLRQWRDTRADLRAKLANKDIIWLCGGNGFYLTWILRETGADEIIKELVRAGTVYAGWSAGAVVAGPTLRFFEPLEDLSVVPAMVHDGLGLTDLVTLPHYDMPEFGAGMKEAERHLNEAGFTTVPLIESQAIVIDGETHRVI